MNQNKLPSWAQYDRILALDLETSGLSSQWDFITQIGAVVMESGAVVGDPLSIRTRPTSLAKVKISVEALSVQVGDLEEEGSADKLSQWFEELRASTPARSAATMLMEWVGAHDAAELPVVAFNASFDHAFLSALASQQRGAISFDSWPSPLWICPMEIAKRVIPGGKHYSLDAVSVLLDLPKRPPNHDALQDAILAGLAYFALQARCPDLASLNSRLEVSE